MPLGGLIPYNDEEERRRRRLLTEEDYPGAAPPALPEVSTGRPALSAAGNPGSVTPPTFPSRRPSRFEEMEEAKGAYMEKTPGRGRAGILGGLQAIAGGGGQDLGQTVGQGIGGLIGGLINPRGVRERQFNQQVRPQIESRFKAEDQERAADRQMEADTLGAELKRAQIGSINRSNQPAPPRAPSFGNAPGLGIYNQGTGQVTVPAPPEQPKQPPSRFVVNDRGEYEDVAAAQAAGRKVKAFQKPKASGGGGKAKESPKVVSMTQIRAYMKATGKSRSDAIADAMRDGYRIAK